MPTNFDWRAGLAGFLAPGSQNILERLQMGYLGGMGAGELAAQQEEATALNEARYERALGELADLQRYVDNQISMATGHQRQELQLLRNRVTTQQRALTDEQSRMFGQRQREMGAGYGSRTAQGIQELGALQAQTARGYDTRRGNALGYFDQFSQGLGQDYGRLRGGELSYLDQFGRALTGGYQNRLAQGMGYLEGGSEQARRDIERRYQAMGSDVQASLAERGLGGTSIVGNAALGVEREKSDELRRQDEAMRREYLDAYSRLSGEGLAAQERMGMARSGLSERLGTLGLASQERMGTARSALSERLSGEALRSASELGQFGFMGRAGLRQDELEAMNRLAEERQGTMRDLGREGYMLDMQTMAPLIDLYGREMESRIGARTGITGARTGIMERRQDLYPTSNYYLDAMNAFGQRNAPTPETQTDWLTPTIGAAGSLGSAALLSGALSGGGAGSLALLGLLSDRALKDNIRVLGPKETKAMLSYIKKLPISRWNYIEDGLEHIGPMAQDFHGAFKVGQETAIYPIDGIGIALAAIKGLLQRVEELEAKVKG